VRRRKDQYTARRQRRASFAATAQCIIFCQQRGDVPNWNQTCGRPSVRPFAQRPAACPMTARLPAGPALGALPGTEVQDGTRMRNVTPATWRPAAC